MVGIVFKLKVEDKVFNTDDLDFQVAPILLIVVGVFVFVVSFFGCCGAIKKNSCMLNTYGVILLVILVFQLAVGIYALVYVNKENLKNSLKDAMVDALKKYDSNNDIKDFFDTTQTKVSCLLQHEQRKLYVFVAQYYLLLFAIIFMIKFSCISR